MGWGRSQTLLRSPGQLLTLPMVLESALLLGISTEGLTRVENRIEGEPENQPRVGALEVGTGH